MANEKRNAALVTSLESALRSGDHGLKTVPGLLRRVLEEDAWRDFVTQRGEHVHHDRFEQFVVAKPLKGIGASVALIERVIDDDDIAVRLFRDVMKRQSGPNPTDNISRIDDSRRKRATPTGTSRSYALQRLESDAPELHAEVLVGKLSAHAAMVQAGFRPPTFTVRANDPDSIAKTLRKRLDPDVLAEVARRLAS